jgi:hypothetical protein
VRCTRQVGESASCATAIAMHNAGKTKSDNRHSSLMGARDQCLHIKNLEMAMKQHSSGEQPQSCKGVLTYFVKRNPFGRASSPPRKYPVKFMSASMWSHRTVSKSTGSVVSCVSRLMTLRLASVLNACMPAKNSAMTPQTSDGMDSC